MRIHHVVAIGFIGLLAVLAVSCSKMSPELEADVRQSFGVPPDMPMKDLGVVKLRPGIPKQVRLGPHKDCTITTTVLTNGRVQLNLLYEFRGELAKGVRAQPHFERWQSVFRPVSVAGWRLCHSPKHERFVLAFEPRIMP